eukprot:2632608-Alexandrium_andersonii.AAC.2
MEEARPNLLSLFMHAACTATASGCQRSPGPGLDALSRAAKWPIDRANTSGVPWTSKSSGDLTSCMFGTSLAQQGSSRTILGNPLPFGLPPSPLAHKSPLSKASAHEA